MIELVLASVVTAIVLLVVIYILIMIYTRRVVPPNYVDVVVNADGTKAYSSNTQYSPTGQTVYHEYPEWVPLIGNKVVRIPLEIIDIPIRGLTLFDSQRAMFNCDLHAYIVIDNPMLAATRIQDIQSMQQQLVDILQANARGSSTTKTLQEIMTDRTDLVTSLRNQIVIEVPKWGASLNSIELLSFDDAPGTNNVSNLAKQREAEIESFTRQQVAVNKKKATMVEAKSQEDAEKRVIAMERAINVADQEKETAIYEKEKVTKEHAFAVEKVEIVKHEENLKEQRKIQGEAEKEFASGQADAESLRITKPGEARAHITKVTFEAEADGMSAKVSKIGEAEASIRKKKLIAEADGKERIKDVMNAFTQLGVTASVAEQLVDMEKTVNVETAKALSNADLRILSGGDQEGFSLSKLIQSLRVGDNDSAKAVLNRFGRPNDLGFSNWDDFLTSLEKPKPSKHKSKQSQEVSGSENIGQ